MAALPLALYLVTGLLVITVLLPLWRKDIWIIRGFDFPRLQKFSLLLIVSLCWMYYISQGVAWYDYLMLAIVLACLVYLLILILPFSPLGQKMILNAEPHRENPTLYVLVFNVYQHNRQYDQVVQLVKDRNPDIVFLLETDEGWLTGIQSIREHYPYAIEIPLKNTYGLLFYSKWPIVHHEVHYLIDKEIPSVAVDVAFHHHVIKVFGLHPSPPAPQENTHSTDRDAEILLVGKMAKEEKGPCLVMGDLNDVAWSYTTTLFLKISGLLDPRRGRGLYSTFHAKYPFLRWPLDHFFVSTHFRLVDMKVEKHLGSDHFPISIGLVISGQEEDRSLPEDSDDRALADDKIVAGRVANPR